MKRFVIAFLCALFFSANALAGNYTGIWWNSSESGWGLIFRSKAM